MIIFIPDHVLPYLNLHHTQPTHLRLTLISVSLYRKTVKPRIITHASTGTEWSALKDVHSVLTTACPPTLHHSQCRTKHPPMLSNPDGPSKLQSCATARPQSISPSDSDSPAELSTWSNNGPQLLVLRASEKERETGGQKDGRRGKKGGREKKQWQTQSSPQWSPIVLSIVHYGKQ